MPDNLYYTQKVRGFQQQKVEKAQNRLIYHLKRTKHRCPCCGSTHVAAEAISERQVRGEPMGACRHVFLRFTTHRLYGHKCRNRNEDAKAVLQNIRTHFKELADAYMFKESLRSIYRTVTDSYHADLAFHRWCRLAEETQIPELKVMAKTIRNNLDGIKTFWTFRHREYFKLKNLSAARNFVRKDVVIYVRKRRRGKELPDTPRN